MNNDQLLFTAGNAAQRAVELLKASWQAGRLDVATSQQLREAALQLQCAALELDARVRGVPEPVNTRG